MKKRHLYMILLFAACILSTPQSVIYKGFEDSSHAKLASFSYLKAKDATKGNLEQTASTKQDFILAFSESKVIFNSSKDNNNDFLSPNNKEYLYNHTLNSYISKMKSSACNARSLSDLNVLRI